MVSFFVFLTVYFKVCIYGVNSDPPQQKRVHHCLDSWQIGQCFLAHFITLLSLYTKIQTRSNKEARGTRWWVIKMIKAEMDFLFLVLVFKQTEIQSEHILPPLVKQKTLLKVTLPEKTQCSALLKAWTSFLYQFRSYLEKASSLLMVMRWVLSLPL